MKTLDQINFSGKRALMRVDFNVPLDKSYAITDDARIRATIPTISKILQHGGSCVLMSHLGRPKGGPEEKYSLKFVPADNYKFMVIADQNKNNGWNTGDFKNRIQPEKIFRYEKTYPLKGGWDLDIDLKIEE